MSDGRALRAAGRTTKGDIGAEVIAVDHEDGWDMHTNIYAAGTLPTPEKSQKKRSVTSSAVV